MLKKYTALQVWFVTRKNKKEKGQSLAEYGLILALIAVFCIAALTTLGESISDMFDQIASEISGAA